jgi:hypothetical protein
MYFLILGCVIQGKRMGRPLLIIDKILARFIKLQNVIGAKGLDGCHGKDVIAQEPMRRGFPKAEITDFESANLSICCMLEVI